MAMNQTEQIERWIYEYIVNSKEDYVIITSGNVHRQMGLANRMPSVCGAMRNLGKKLRHGLVHVTESGNSSTFEVGYYKNTDGEYDNYDLFPQNADESKRVKREGKAKEDIHLTSRTINLRLRHIVMKRDGYKCRICGRSPALYPGLELQVDHILPWSKGGETTEENLQTLCRDCNLGKSNL